MLHLSLSLIDNGDDKFKFETLVLKYERQMFYIANNIIDDIGLAEDAVQIVLFSLAKDFKKVSTFDENKIKARLYIMIKNASINIMKKRERFNEMFLGDNELPIHKSETNIEALVESKIGYGKLMEQINQLPVHYREVLYLEQVTECSIKEIASILGLKYDTVQKRLMRAKRMLREKLIEGGEVYDTKSVKTSSW